METVTTICVFLVMFGTGQTNAFSKQEIYNHGDNATVLFEKIPTDGRKSFEIYFSGFTKKLHGILMIIIVPKTNNENYIQVSRNYNGRIKDINMNNDNITFILLNVNFMDSGNYKVLEGSLENGKRSILVTRRILNGQVSKPMILPFMCNNTNTSSIKIGRSHAFENVDYIIYDVARKSCTYTMVTLDYKDRNISCVLNDANFDLTFRELIWLDKGAYIAWDDQGLLLDVLFIGIPVCKNCIYTSVTLDYRDRIDSCVLNDTNFNLIIRELTWSDKGVYTAWDDQGLLLDSIFIGIPDNNISAPRGTFGTNFSCQQEQNDYEYVYYFDGKLIWLLVSAVVNVLLLASLAIIAVRKFRHRKGQKTKEEKINCSDPDVTMFQATNTALQSDDDDERKYEEPRSNDMELTAYLEPNSQPVNEYQRLHPYENQGNNMYRSLRPENII